MRTSLTLAGVLAALLVAHAAPAPAGGERGRAIAPSADVLLTVDEALELAFGDADATKRTHYLTKEQRAAVEDALGAELDSAVARPYEVRDADGVLIGLAWFDTHRVRSKRETTMTAVDACGEVRRVEVLAFAEPKRYLPKRSFYAQFDGEALDDDLVLDGDVRNVAGATLTSRATIDAARRALALQGVLYPPPAEPPSAEDGDEEKDDGDDTTDRPSDAARR